MWDVLPTRDNQFSATVVLVLDVIMLISFIGVGCPMLAFGAILIVPARSVPEEPCVREF